MPRKASKPKVAAASVDLSALLEPDTYVDQANPVPDEVIEFVEDAYEYWLTHQTRWRTVNLPSKAAAEVTVREARRYCSSVRDEPLTFQTKGYEDGNTTLVYRAREAVRRARGAALDSADQDGADDDQDGADDE